MIDPLRALALAAIRFYQRFVSPAKGFSCAYRVHTGRASCSVLGFRAVRRHGVFGGLGLLRDRLDLCGEAYRRYQVPRHAHHRLHAQRGFCDAGCDAPCDPSCDAPCGTDVPSGEGLCDACGPWDLCDVGDCGSSERRPRRSARHRRAGEDGTRTVYLPPRRG